jgi:Fe-Mn family superoxide dismutase
MPFTLPDLPYPKNALGDYMSAETLTFHHDKHHKAYVDRTNQLVEEKGLGEMRLSELIVDAKAKGEKTLFNQSAQIWNHSFYWNCLAAPQGQRPTGRLAEMIGEAYGSTENLLAELKKEAVGHFSNGWAWLILNGDRLQITSLHDADTPVAYEEMKPLLTLDVWEHAYYIDYRNARPDFAEKVLGNIVNWEFVAQNLDGNGVSRADQG